MDGKQARKTGNASSLGLLFDHGLDCITTPIIALNVLHILRGTMPMYAILIILITLNFHMATYEQYVSHSLDLDIINPVNEGVTAVFIIAFVFGFIGNEKADYMSFLPGITWKYLFYYILLMSIVGNVAKSLWLYHKHGKFLAFFADSALFFFMNTGFILLYMLSDLEVVVNQPKYVVLAWALIQSKLTIEMMIAHVMDFKVKRLPIYIAILSVVPYVVLIMEKLSVGTWLNTVLKVYLAVSFICKLIRLRLLYLFHS